LIALKANQFIIAAAEGFYQNASALLKKLFEKAFALTERSLFL
jgi:hypothetical protein